MIARVTLPANIGVKSIRAIRQRDEVSNITLGFYVQDALPITDGVIEPGKAGYTVYAPKFPSGYIAKKDLPFDIWFDGMWRWGDRVFPMGQAKVTYQPTWAAVLFFTHADEQSFNTSIEVYFDRPIALADLPDGLRLTEEKTA